MEGVLNPCTSQIANEMEANYKSSKHIVVRLCVCVCVCVCGFASVSIFFLAIKR